MGRIIGLLIAGVMVLASPQSAFAHGGGPESIVSFAGIINWLHFVTTALWLGGIVFLRLAVLPSIHGHSTGAHTLRNAITIRFTHLVWWCIGGLALTGVLTTWVHVPSTTVLTGSAYGIILDLKIAIAAGMIACNAVISAGLAQRGQGTRTRWNPARWVSFASRLSLVLAFFMMVSIAALVEFDRSIWSVTLNFLRLSALTVWFGATAFIPLVLSPALSGIDSAYMVRVNGAIINRFGNLTAVCALVALITTAITIAKNMGAVSDFVETGYGISSLLELATLTAMAMVLARTGFGSGLDLFSGNPPTRLATAKTMRKAIETSAAGLLLGLAALLFSSLSGALYSPKSSILAEEIPTAASALAVDWIEPLGYLVAAVVAAALIWYFGIVEGKLSKENPERESGPEYPQTSGPEG